MCVLLIKKDEMFNPLHAKSPIDVLGNHEDRVWTKPEKYAPVLRPDSMRVMVSLAVEKCRTLKQGDCKNAFCQGILPDDEITIVKPPIGNPDADKDEYWLLKKMLYGLRHSPRHWYNKITSVLASIGLRPNASDPCMFTGSVCNPNNPAADIPSAPLTVGLYVDDFVYFSEDPEVERSVRTTPLQPCHRRFHGDCRLVPGYPFSMVVLRQCGLYAPQPNWLRRSPCRGQ